MSRSSPSMFKQSYRYGMGQSCHTVVHTNLCNHVNSITSRLLPLPFYTDAEPESSGIYREILLSYRLLFGQSRRSRKLLTQILSRKYDSPENNCRPIHIKGNVIPPTVNTTSNPPISTATMPLEATDPFLLTCTLPIRRSKYRNRILSFLGRPDTEPSFPSSIFPVSALDLDDNIQDSDTYSMRDDFPVFGQRLLALQMYNMRQQPSKVTDLWRDRRSPLQWYTFWAVVWVGGVSILLALLQLFVSIVQTAIAGRDE